MAPPNKSYQILLDPITDSTISASPNIKQVWVLRNSQLNDLSYMRTWGRRTEFSPIKEKSYMKLLYKAQEKLTMFNNF